MEVDANIVIDKLTLQIAQQAREIAILQATIEVLNKPSQK